MYEFDYSSPSLLNEYLWYDKLWGPSQRVVTLFKDDARKFENSIKAEGLKAVLPIINQGCLIMRVTYLQGWDDIF